MQTVRWGIVGCGDVCEVKSGPALAKAAGSELRAVMRRDRGRAEDFARRHGVAEFTDDARRLIENPRVDAVYVATPPGSHLAYALAAAEAGKPCYVEKPMARNAREAQTMIDAFAARGLPLFVAYYRRALPRFTLARRLLADGVLGDLRSLSHVYRGRAASRAEGEEPPRQGWREQVPESGGGLFLDLGSHVMDLIDYLCGPLQALQGVARRRTRGPAAGLPEDTVVASFATSSGLLGTVQHAYHTAEAVDRLEIAGDRGRLVMSVFGSEPLVLHTARGRESLAVAHPEHVQQPLVQTLVDELLGVGGPCPSTGATALRASVAMDRILADYYGGRDDEFWARPETWPGGHG
jgi:1,5-anhydro-D-fructose reductase (1,5-anhydro-D-mannitol-forming)